MIHHFIVEKNKYCFFKETNDPATMIPTRPHKGQSRARIRTHLSLTLVWPCMSQDQDVLTVQRLPRSAEPSQTVSIFDRRTG